jgi:transcriptional regulator with XRE-family HTH domain
MVNVAEQFAANLVRLRRQAGLSQEQLAFRAELHRTEIGMAERGVRLVKIDTLLKLAGALGVEPGDLLAGLKWQPGESRVGQFSAPDQDATL